MERFNPHSSQEVTVHPLRLHNVLDGKQPTPFLVAAANESIGVFHASRTKSHPSSFEWKAKVDFLHVEKSVSELSTVLLERQFDFRNPKEFQVVAQVSQRSLRNKGGQTILRSEPATMHYLTSVKEFINYRRKMANDPSTVGSVHYDIRDMQSEHAFSIQIGNPALSPMAEAKMRLFTDKPWSEDIVGWVMRHHEKEEKFHQSGIKPKEIVHVLFALDEANSSGK